MSMAETSLISCRRSHIKARLHVIKHAKIVDHLLSHPGEFLSSLQIGITVISIFSGAYSGQQLAEPLSLWLNTFPIFHGYGSPIAFGLIVIILTYVSLLMSELVPKRIALSYPEKIALRMAYFVDALTRSCYYIVKILDSSTRLILRILGFNEQSQRALTGEDFLHIFKQGLEDGAINTFEHNVFRKVMIFGNNEARSIMTPRIKVCLIHIDDTIDKIIAQILYAPHRYYPVITHNPESMLGIIDTKEVLNKKLNNEVIDIKSMIQKAPIVIEDNSGPHVLQCFRDQHIQIALVIDEYGVFKGIITPHDVLESLIGALANIQERADKNIILQDDGSWMCGGLTSIHTLEELLHIIMEDPLQGDDFNTLAGFMLSHLNHVPHIDECFTYKGFEFKVKEMENQRISQAIITPILSHDVTL